MLHLDQEVVNQIRRVVEVIHSPLSGMEERRKAQAWCEEIMKEVGKYGYYGVYLGGRGMIEEKDIVRHFGLHMMEYAIRYGWPTYSTEEKEQWKTWTMEVIYQCMKRDEWKDEKRYVKEKMARVMVELVKREWPQRWMTWMDSILGMIDYQHNPLKQGEMVFLILRVLGEDVFVYKDEKMNERRHTELVNGLNACLPMVILAMKKYLEYLLSIYNEIPGQVDYVEHALICILECFATYCDFIAWNYIKEFDLVGLLSQMFINMQGKKEIQVEICECLLVLTCRKGKVVEERKCIMDMMKYMDGFGNILIGSLKAMEEEKEDNWDAWYPLQKRICQMLASFGIYQLNIKSPTVPESITSYFNLMLSLTRHDSLVISSFTLPLWTSLLNHESYIEYLSPMGSDLLEVAAQRLIKIGDPEHDQSHSARYSHVDFGSSLDFKKFYASYRNQLVDMVKRITVIKLIDSFIFTVNLIHQLIIQPILIQKKNEMGNASIYDMYYIFFEGRTSLVEAVTTALQKDFFDRNDEQGLMVQEITGKLLESLFRYECQDALILSRYLSILACFFPFFQKNDVWLVAVIEKLFQFVLYKNSEVISSDAKRTVVEDTLALRRKSCIILIKMASTMSDKLVIHFTAIANWMQDIFGKNLVTEGEKTYLIEFFVILCNSIADISQRLAYFSSLINPLISEWTSQNMLSIFRDDLSFLSAIGIDEISSIVSTIPEDQLKKVVLSTEQMSFFQEKFRLRKKILYLLDTFHVFFKRTNEMPDIKNALSEIYTNSFLDFEHYCTAQYQAILPTVLSVVRVLQSLWDHNRWATYPPILIKLLDINDREKALILGIDMDDTHISHTRNSEALETQLLSYRMFLGALRETSYHILLEGTMLLKGFYGIPMLSNLLVESIFFQIEFIENRHMKSLINIFLRPFLLRCPLYYYKLVLLPILPGLLNCIGLRLEKEWETILMASTTDKVSRESTTISDEGEDETDEISTEKILRDCSRACIEMLYDIFDPIRHEPSSSDNIREYDFGKNKPLVDFLSKEILIADPLIRLLAYCLTWKDTLTARRAIVVCHRIIELTFDRVSYYELLGKVLLIASLKALHDGYHQEAHMDLIGLINHIYLKVRPSSLFPKEVFMSLPNMTIDHLNEFELKLSQEKSEKKQKVIMRKFLQDITGVSISQLFKAKETFILDLPERLFIQRFDKQPDPNPLSFSEESDIGLLSELFSDEKLMK